MNYMHFYYRIVSSFKSVIKTTLEPDAPGAHTQVVHNVVYCISYFVHPLYAFVPCGIGRLSAPYINVKK